MRELGRPAARGRTIPSRCRAARARRRSIWPAMYPELLELVRAHRSTLIFVNNRRLAERLALRLNELAEEEVARAHHGALAAGAARRDRGGAEGRARCPCLVATSSLELGIDMGAIDLVIQVEAPRSVARGLQRIGRAGHQVGGRQPRAWCSPSTAATCSSAPPWSSRMQRGAIEETRVPRQPLDVLAQQIVAMCAERDVDGRRPRTRWCAARTPSPSCRASSSRGCSTCSPAATPPTSSPSCGRGWCGTAVAGTVRGRDGARPLAVQNAGTIPDRGPLRRGAARRRGGWASWTRRWSTRPARARRSCSAPPPGASRRSPATGWS